MEFSFFATAVEEALVVLPTIVITWGALFCGEKCTTIELSWVKWSVGVQIN